MLVSLEHVDDRKSYLICDINAVTIYQDSGIIVRNIYFYDQIYSKCKYRIEQDEIS